MRRRPAAALLLSVLGAAALAGCGITDPYAGTKAATSTSTNSSPATVTNADPAPERGGAIPASARAAQSRLSAIAAKPTPRAVLQQYARLYVNWTAANVAAVQRELASSSDGQARAQALQAAASYTRDRTLAQSGVANSGQLIAITPNITTPGQWVLVTSEQTTGTGDYSGLPPTLHVIYAQVTWTPKGWVVSEWAPQN
jgi:hypothetical protein